MGVEEELAADAAAAEKHVMSIVLMSIIGGGVLLAVGIWLVMLAKATWNAGP